MQMVEEEDIEFIRLQFTDIYGTLRNMAITASQLEGTLDNECIFDATQIDGFAEDEELELYLYPDLDSFVLLPWRPDTCRVARLICDIHNADGTPYERCSRGILKRVLAKASDMGYDFIAGPECEFFLFHTEEDGTPTTQTHDMAGYFDLGPVDLGENARRDMVLTLEKMGFEVESSYHEVANGQHEIDFHQCRGLEAADSLVTFKFVVRMIAKLHGLHATFMPKPLTKKSGSGMHVNCVLRDYLGKNLFDDACDANGLSREAYHFMGGVLAHIRGMSVLTNPLVNSYKRMVPGYGAPFYIGWGTKSKGQLLRVSRVSPGKTKIELRSPDPSANPYLALAAVLAAGLDGIRNQIPVPARLDKEDRPVSEAEMIAAGVGTLPASLKEAIDAYRADPFFEKLLGKPMSDAYIKAKEGEWADYSLHVSDWEISKDLYRI